MNFVASIFKYAEVEKVGFIGCDFAKSVFNGVTFKNVSFKDCEFDDSAFRDCKFLACDFSEVKKLQNCFLAGCDMIECTMPDGDDVVIRTEVFYLDEENATDEVTRLSIDFLDSEATTGDEAIEDNKKAETL